MMCRSCSASGATSAGTREHLDHDHAGAAARAWTRQHTRRIRRNIWRLLRVSGRRGDIEECACHRDVLGSLGVGKEPVVADAVEAHLLLASQPKFDLRRGCSMWGSTGARNPALRRFSIGIFFATEPSWH